MIIPLETNNNFSVGGGVQFFFRGSFTLLIPKETYSTCNFPRGGGCMKLFTYRKAVFVRLSYEYAANVLQTALLTVIVRYIFTSCRKYPADKVGLTKK